MFSLTVIDLDLEAGLLLVFVIALLVASRGGCEDLPQLPPTSLDR